MLVQEMAPLLDDAVGDDRQAVLSGLLDRLAEHVASAQTRGTWARSSSRNRHTHRRVPR